MDMKAVKCKLYVTTRAGVIIDLGEFESKSAVRKYLQVVNWFSSYQIVKL